VEEISQEVEQPQEPEVELPGESNAPEPEDNKKLEDDISSFPND